MERSRLSPIRGHERTAGRIVHEGVAAEFFIRTTDFERVRRQQRRKESNDMAKMRRAKPTLDDLGPKYAEKYTELLNESDRGLALAGAALLDEILGLMLSAFFVDDKNATAGLLDGDRPLSNFSARTKIAYCLGLIGVRTYADLNAIREIRNRFAHRFEKVSFDDSGIADICRSLRMYNAFKTFPKDGSPRARFGLSIVFLSYHLRTEASSLRHCTAAQSADFPILP
jgi:mannitol operon repressor